MSSVRLYRIVRSDKAFSMVEVLIAMALFVSSIIGISMMLMSGSAAITRGAMESQATELAQKKIEEVKSLQYYSPWTGANKDIDDNYWAFDGDTPRGNDVQFDYPVVEDYGTISGREQYRRTTAVQYQDVTNGIFSEATMDSNWVPKSMTANSVVSPYFDMPRDSSMGKVRALIVEVRVYFKPSDVGGREITHVSRGVVSDLMVTGGSNNPILVIEEINPIEGELNETNLTMDITVQSEGLQEDYDAGGKITASLWYEGQTTIPCKEYEAGAGGSAVVSSSGTNIRCHFNLSDHSYTDWDDDSTVKDVVVRPGLYSLEIYWKNQGWRDTSFRNCFTVIAPPPVYDSLTNFNWGHNGQGARQLTVNGSALHNATIALTKEGETSIPGNITSNTGTQIEANFNLSSITGVDERWDVEITTIGGTVVSDSDAKRLYANPKPVITQVTPMPAGSQTVFDWAHAGQTSRPVQIEGNYLYGFDHASTTKTLKYDVARQTDPAAFVSGSAYSDNNAVAGTPVVLNFDPSSGFSSVADRYNTPNTQWDPYLINAGGTASISNDAQRVHMNPPPVIAFINSGGSYDDQWGHSGQTAKSVHMAARGAYDTDVAGAQCILTSPDGTYTTPNATGGLWNSEWAQSYSYSTNISGWGTFDFDASGAGFNEPETMWNLTITNYGGTATSDTDAKRFEMNPKPIITSVSPTSSPNYYDWGYRAQTSRKVRITGEYLYGFTDAGSERRLNYSGHGTHQTSDANWVSGNDDTEVILNYNLTTAGADANENDTPWNAHLANYGGLADYKDAGRVLMNPPPTVTAKGGFPGTANTGLAAGPTKIYSGLSLTGTYLQDGVTEAYMSRSAQTPGTGTTCMNLAQDVSPTTNPAGSSISGLNMRMHVNPVNNSFWKWGGGTPNNDAIAGTYYVYYKNPDGQVCTTTLTEPVAHAQYSYNVTSKQPGWGQVTGGGTRYQDEIVTLTASGLSPGVGWYYWQNSSGADLDRTTYPNPYVFTAGASVPMTRARFYYFLYDGRFSANYANMTGGSGIARWAGGGTKYVPDPNYSYTNDNPGDDYAGTLLRVRAIGTRRGTADVGCRPTNTIDFTGATKVNIMWRQKNGDAGNEYWTICKSADAFGSESDGQLDWWQGDRSWEAYSYNINTASGYIRVHAYGERAWWTNGDADVRVRWIYLE